MNLLERRRAIMSRKEERQTVYYLTPNEDGYIPPIKIHVRAGDVLKYSWRNIVKSPVRILAAFRDGAKSTTAAADDDWTTTYRSVNTDDWRLTVETGGTLLVSTKRWPPLDGWQTSALRADWVKLEII